MVEGDWARLDPCELLRLPSLFARAACCLLLVCRRMTGTVEQRRGFFFFLALGRRDAGVFLSLVRERQRQRGTYIHMARAECGFPAWDLGLIRHGNLSAKEGGVTLGPAVGAEGLLALTSFCLARVRRR